MIEKENNIGFIFGLIGITAVFALGGTRIINLPDEQMQAGKWVTHTQEVLRQLETLSLDIDRAELGQRDYALTSDPAYQSSYKTAESQIDRDLKDFQHLTQDNPLQQNRILSLEKTISEKLADLQKDTARAKESSVEPVLKTLVDHQDLKLTKEINRQIAEMKSEEERLMQMRLSTWHLQASYTRELFVIGGVLLYGMICAFCSVLYRMALQRKRLLDIEQVTSAAQRQKADYLEKIVSIQRAIAGQSLDLQSVLKTIVDNTQELVGAEGSIVEMLEGDQMVYHAASGTAEAHIGLKLSAAMSFSGLCIRENTVLKCDDSETDDRVDKAACRTVGLRSMIVVPLRHQGNAIGVLKVLSSAPHYFTQEQTNTLELMAGLLSAALGDAIAANDMRATNQELKALNIDLEKLAITDGLTGLENHRSFQKNLAREYDLAARHNKPLSVLLLDVDFFKKFNDAFGHPAGDVVLKRVGVILKQMARTTDCVARYGGEEFVLVLPETPLESAMIIATRIQQAVAGDTWEHRAITVSIGVSALNKSVPSAAELVKAADKALYGAKEKGRNCVVSAASA